MSADLAATLRVVERQLGLRCSGVRADVIAEVVRATMAATDAEPAAFARQLAVDADLRGVVAEALRVPETHFLRDPRQLEVLVSDVLPRLVADRGPAHELHLWSAGCASGEEAYTLAMLAVDAGLAGRARVLATDRSSSAVDEAAAGTYRRWSLRGVDDTAQRRWFSAVEDGLVRVADELLDLVDVQQHDLVADGYPQHLDLIVCRNVLLYLTPEAGAAVVDRLAAALAPGGWLVLGAADPHHAAARHLDRVRTPGGAFYRRPDRTTNRGPATGSDGCAHHHTDRAPRPSRGPGTPARSGRGGAPAAPVVTAPATPSTDGAGPELAQLEAAIETAPLDPAVRCRLGTLLVERADPERALELARDALFLDPGSPVAHLVRGRAHLALGRPDRARGAFAAARELLEALPADAPVDGADEPAGRLLRAARAGEDRPDRGDRP